MPPVLQLGTREQRSCLPVKTLHRKEQKARGLAKAVTFQATSEANSCFRALRTGACVLLCLANILQAANRINRASIKTNTQIKHPKHLPAAAKTTGTSDGGISAICVPY